MQTAPHIDIVGDERIREILESPETDVFSAFACETLDGWVPDIGLTPPHRSVYKPRAEVTVS
jgi:hypothetical protein